MTRQAEVFEEVPTMEHAFEGIPTVPPHKDLVRGREQWGEKGAREAGGRERPAVAGDKLAGGTRLMV